MSLVFHPALIYYKPEKFTNFLRSSTDYFIELFEIIIVRIMETDPELIRATNILQFVEDHIFADVNFINIFNQYNIPINEYIQIIGNRFLNIISEENKKRKKPVIF